MTTRTTEAVRAEIRTIRATFIGAMGNRNAYLQDELEKLRARRVAEQILRLEDELATLTKEGEPRGA